MEIIWHGTASVEIRSNAGRIIFDPFIPLKGSDVPVAAEDFDGFDDIIITHGHLDHIGSLKHIHKRNPTSVIYCTETPYKTLRKKKIPSGKLVKIDYGQTLNIQGFTITVYHGKHADLPRLNRKWIKSMLASPAHRNIPYLIRENRRCRENGETAIFIAEAEGKRVAVMGSMNLRDDVDYPENCDILILPYNGWADNLPPAARIIERLNPKRVLLDHYDDTFPPVCIEVDPAPVIKLFGDKVEALKHNHPVII